MATSPPISAPSVVTDANFVIAICSRKPGTYAPARAQLVQYAIDGCDFYAPGVLFAEALFALCRKVTDGLLTPAEHAQAVHSLRTIAQVIQAPPDGEAALIERAEQTRAGYGCSRSADGLYLALAERRAEAGPTELVTFDLDLQQQATILSPAVTVRLLDAV